MYVYLYDNFLSNKKFDAIVKSMEVRLTDYGIAGKILRLNNFIDVKPIIDDEIKRGATTIVIVGNDKTFGNVLSRSATCKVTFGFLPVGPDNTISDVLGIPINLESCDVLSRRLRERLDVGWVNNRYFVSQLHVYPSKIEVDYDEKFRVKSENELEIVVCNLQPFFWKTDKKDRNQVTVNPKDGKLEAFLRPAKKKRWFGKYTYEQASVFPFEEMIIRSDTAFEIEADGKKTKEKKIKIKLAPSRIDVIVGRERKF